MGSSQSNEAIKSTPAKINLANWKFIQSPDYIKASTYIDSLQTYANIVTKQVVHRFKIETDKQENINKCYQALHWRNNQKNVLYISHIFQPKPNTSNLTDKFCSHSKIHLIYVCVQQIIIRLSAIKDIPYPQNLYFLIGCLDGFQPLFNLVGYFQICEDMICIDKQGKIKVWMNSNLSQNTPNQGEKVFRQKNNIIRNFHNSQTQFVHNIIKMVCRNTDEKSQPQSLYQYLCNQTNMKKISFSICRKQVLKYAEQFKTYIPQKFASIIQILNQGNNSQERSNNSKKQVLKSQRQSGSKQQQNNNQSSPLSLSDQNHILYGKNYKNNYLLDEESSQKKRMHTSNLQIPENESQNYNKDSQSQSNDRIYFLEKQQDLKLSDSSIKGTNLFKTVNEGQHSIKHEFSSSQHSVQSPTLSINKRINKQNLGIKNEKFVSDKQDQGRKITFSYAVDSRKQTNNIENEYGSIIHNYEQNYRITQSNLLFNQYNNKVKITDSSFVNNTGFIKTNHLPSNTHQRNSTIKQEFEEEIQSNQNTHSKQVTPRQTKNQANTQTQMNNLKEYQKNNFVDQNQTKQSKNYDLFNGFNRLPSSKKSIKLKTTFSNQYYQHALISPKKIASGNKIQNKILFKDSIREYQLDLEIAEDLRRICIS